jgi:hypothetical protein
MLCYAILFYAILYYTNPHTPHPLPPPLDKENEKMILKVSQDGAGFSVPLRGLAGHIARTGEILNLPDCYDDHRCVA